MNKEQILHFKMRQGMKGVFLEIRGKELRGRSSRVYIHVFVIFYDPVMEYIARMLLSIYYYMS